MITAITIIKLIIKLLLFIILFPFILIWFFIKSQIFKISFKRNLYKNGVSKNNANEMAKELNILKILKSFNTK